MKTELTELALSIVEAAQKLGISRGLCYRLVREGRIPSVRLGRRIVIPLAAIVKMLSATTNKEEKGHGKEKP